MAASKTEWRRRWLPPLLVAAGLVVLAGGVTLALTASRTSSGSLAGCLPPAARSTPWWPSCSCGGCGRAGVIHRLGTDTRRGGAPPHRQPPPHCRWRRCWQHPGRRQPLWVPGLTAWVWGRDTTTTVGAAASQEAVMGQQRGWGQLRGRGPGALARPSVAVAGWPELALRGGRPAVGSCRLGRQPGMTRESSQGKQGTAAKL